MGEETKKDVPSFDREVVGSNWSEKSEKEAVRYLFTLGEVAQVSLIRGTNSVVFFVQRLSSSLRFKLH